MKKLYIISNESVHRQNEDFFCDNIDMKSTPEALNKNFEINIIARSSDKKRSHKINLENIYIYKNIFSYLIGIIKSFKDNENKYLIISISPYTLMACVIIKIFRRKSIVYLRSDGYGEYKVVFGKLGLLIYHIMFNVVNITSKFISCRKYILRQKKGILVSPSQLNNSWISNIKKNNFDKIKLLYIGRIRSEKGIFSLISIIEECNDLTITIVGAEKDYEDIKYKKNINIVGIENNEQKLINYYDNHSIFILPSFTEGHPMVLLEALARHRPVIIFKEIEHVIGSKKGIFIAERNSKDFIKTVNYIKNNYKKIQENMKKNVLPTKSSFIEELKNSIMTLSQ